MSKEVTKLEARSGYHLYVEFSDGTAGMIDLSDRLFGPVFEPLRDKALFDQVRVDEFGAICWPNGADLAPDAVYMRLAESEEASATG
jgi:hypothetical protein